MHLDVLDLRSFYYRTNLGRVAQKAVRDQVLMELARRLRGFLRASDVLSRLGMSPGARRTSQELRPAPQGQAAIVLDALGWQASTLEQLLARCELSLEVVSVALADLERSGWVTERGGWFERRARGEDPR